MNSASIWLIPSFYAHVANGLLLLLALIILWQHYSQIRRLDAYRLLVLALLGSLAIGVHGVSHLGMELGYGYNPLHV